MSRKSGKDVLAAVHSNASSDTIARNPHLFSGQPQESPPVRKAPEKPKQRRIRQNHKPILNKLETQFFQYIKVRLGPDWELYPQAMRFRLANGLYYKPDFIACHKSDRRLWIYEVKGPRAFRGGFENLKMAASVYRHFKWFLAWKKKGSMEWLFQEVIP